MPPYLDDELSKIDDITALLITARTLTMRFSDQDMRPITMRISAVVSELQAVREHKEGKL